MPVLERACLASVSVRATVNGSLHIICVRELAVLWDVEEPQSSPARFAFCWRCAYNGECTFCVRFRMLFSLCIVCVSRNQFVLRA